LRVLATVVNHPDDGVVREFESQSRDLAAWAGEIIEGTWAQPRVRPSSSLLSLLPRSCALSTSTL